MLSAQLFKTRSKNDFGKNFLFPLLPNKDENGPFYKDVYQDGSQEALL